MSPVAVALIRLHMDSPQYGESAIWCSKVELSRTFAFHNAFHKRYNGPAAFVWIQHTLVVSSIHWSTRPRVAGSRFATRNKRASLHGPFPLDDCTAPPGRSSSHKRWVHQFWNKWCWLSKTGAPRSEWPTPLKPVRARWEGCAWCGRAHLFF